MAIESIEVLRKLVKTGIWSFNDNVLRFKHLVLDVESVVEFIYRLCIKNHLKRSKTSANDAMTVWATLIDYTEFSCSIRILLQFFRKHRIHLLLIYRGRYMEAPLYGLIPAQFARNNKKVSKLIGNLKLDKKGCNPDNWPRSHLAMIIFKKIVRKEIRDNSNIFLTPIQAYYSQFPTMTKLARDFKCPVLTNEGEFILYDVKAGFLMFDEFWSKYIDSKNTSSPRTSLVMCKFNYNHSFLRQHPGATPYLALNIFPLVFPDFIDAYSKSLQRLNVINKASSSMNTTRNYFEAYHRAADRLDDTIRFLCGRNHFTLSSLLRGESERFKNELDETYTNLLSYYTCAFEFKYRLRQITHLHEPLELNYIEWCLINRECTANCLLNILVSSCGNLATVSHNHYLQFEDTRMKHSALSIMNRIMQTIMELTYIDKSNHNDNINSVSKSKDTREPGSITIMDRFRGELMERTLTRGLKDPEFLHLSPKIQFPMIAKNSIKVSDSIRLISIVFKTLDLTSLPRIISNKVLKKVKGIPKDILQELSILINLLQFSLSQAAEDDQTFSKSRVKISEAIEEALVDLYLYSCNMIDPKSKEIVSRFRFKDVVHKREANEESLYVRHSIELLSSSLSAYCELNSFLNYPLNQLRLYDYYNPIMLYNLTLYFLHNKT